MSQKQIYGPVLLVCIYNRFGNVLTHDYFYQLFCQYGEVVKILIFGKAKVWKAFIQFQQKQSAEQALRGLDKRIVFEDGSKMNIFSSKFKQVKLQNCNAGGVDYEQLRLEQEIEKEKQVEPRARRSTNPNYSSLIPIDEEEHVCYKPQFEGSTKYSYSSEEQASSTGSSYNSFSIDQQFLQLARQSEQFRKLEIESKKSQQQQKIRLKSKTMLSNPNTDLFLKQNSPCKVLFARSIPKQFSTRNIYNIFSNFGTVAKVVIIQDKGNSLIEFDNIDDAIVAKDELNYSKPEMKIFYSHYQTLTINEQNGGEVFHAVKLESSKKRIINPPSQVLYITLVLPENQNELKTMCSKIGVKIYEISWKLNNNKWACLADFGTINNSLLAMGLLQGMPLESGKSLRFSFTKQKLTKSNKFSA